MRQSARPVRSSRSLLVLLASNVVVLALAVASGWNAVRHVATSIGIWQSCEYRLKAGVAEDWWSPVIFLLLIPAIVGIVLAIRSWLRETDRYLVMAVVMTSVSAVIAIFAVYGFRGSCVS